jgi:hypothetical protein
MTAAAIAMVSLSMNQGWGPLRLSRLLRAASLMTVESLRGLCCCPIGVVGDVGASRVLETIAKMDKAHSDAQRRAMHQSRSAHHVLSI